jgi:hypothetical protein
MGETEDGVNGETEDGVNGETEDGVNGENGGWSEWGKRRMECATR